LTIVANSHSTPTLIFALCRIFFLCSKKKLGTFMVDSSPLTSLLDRIDRLPVVYNRSHAGDFTHGARLVACFPGTKVPMTIHAGTAETDTVVYSETWTCCGEYGCTGNRAHKRTTRTYRCCAQLTVTVRASAGEREACTFSLFENHEHGDAFAMPVAPPAGGRYTWRSKVAIERAARAGVTKVDEMMARYWRPVDMPQPQTAKERDSLRVRLGQRVRALRAVEQAEAAAAALAEAARVARVAVDEAKEAAEAGTLSADDDDDDDVAGDEPQQLSADVRDALVQRMKQCSNRMPGVPEEAHFHAIFRTGRFNGVRDDYCRIAMEAWIAKEFDPWIGHVDELQRQLYDDSWNALLACRHKPQYAPQEKRTTIGEQGVEMVYTLDIGLHFADLMASMRVMREELEHRKVEFAGARALVIAYIVCACILQEEVDNNEAVGFIW
jgi:hypothetical protein